MNRRPISRGQCEWLTQELNAWHGEGILTTEQAGRIRGLYPTDEELTQSDQTRAIFTLVGVGALLVGLAALLVVGYNWEAMPREVKLALLFGAIGGTHALGLYLRFGREVRIWSEVVLFLGCLFYGVGIWQVAQIFHLNAHYPDGVWWWALGVLPFALCLDTILLHALYAGLLAVWVGVEVLGPGSSVRDPEGLGWFLSAGTYSLPLLALPGLLWAYRRQSPLTVALYVPVIAWWLILLPVAWGLRATPVYFIGSAGALLLLLAECHRPGSSFAIPYRAYGLLMCGGALVPISFFDFNTGRIVSIASRGVLVEVLFIAALAVGVLAFAAARLRALAERDGAWSEQLIALLRRQWLPVGLIVLMVALATWNLGVSGPREVRNQLAVLPTILANLAMLGGSIWLMGVGVRDDQGKLFAAGVLYCLLWAVLRYVDLFGDFGGMLGAALMFLLCGLVLLGVALYWRHRKEVRHV